MRKGLEAGEEPSRTDMLEAIFGCPNGKGTGESGIPAKALKAISDDAKDAIADAIIRFWHGEIDTEQLCEVVLICLPKKGDLSQPNNWRLICLNDIFKKVISKIGTKRLLMIIEKYGIKKPVQIPAGERLPRWTLHNMISIGTEMESQPRNMDAICRPEESFGTANHELLYALLVRYGAPDSLIDVICQLHDDFNLNLKLGDEERNIPYKTGIKQGDCMAPVLFLFLMQAFAETLKNKWKEDCQLQAMQSHGMKIQKRDS